VGDPSPRPVSLLGCAILQRLQRTPMSGYELKKRFASSLGFGWRAYDTQIYRELKSLEQAQLVRGWSEEGRAGPRRRVYAPTPAGLGALRAWLESPLADTWQKSELTLRVFSIDQMSVAAVEQLLGEIERETAERLERIVARRNELREKYGMPEMAEDGSYVGNLLVLEHDADYAQLRLRWIERVRAVMQIRARLHAAAPLARAAT
jgi:PadR family transcriptional regulator AphA